MKDKKKNIETENKAKENENLADGMQKLDEGDLEQVSGAGNPFDRARMGFQSIDDNLRNNG